MVPCGDFWEKVPSEESVAGVRVAECVARLPGTVPRVKNSRIRLARRHTCCDRQSSVETEFDRHTHIHSWHRRRTDNRQVEQSLEVTKKWTRSSSLRKHFSRRKTSPKPSDAAALSDGEIGKVSCSSVLLGTDEDSQASSIASERAVDVGRVGAWATSFEKLLDDPSGLHTFAEFLKKEFSHENIYFWVACERYKRIMLVQQRKQKAREIFERHLCIGASEPVNVDSHARQLAQEGLDSPAEGLFAQAQKQIFNLMKFDSYTRFLKSALYKECLMKDMAGQDLPFLGDDSLDPDLRLNVDLAELLHKGLSGHSTSISISLKKSKSDADESRRKSLLPWHRKNRSKSKDRGEAEYRKAKKKQRERDDSSSVRSDVTSSRTSLASSDLVLMQRRTVSRESLNSAELSDRENCQLCRVILPDSSTTVLQTRLGESVQSMVKKLLDKRGIAFTSFDVFSASGEKPLDLSGDSANLGCCEVHIEQRVLFRLEMPNKKTIGVKAKPNKQVHDVLRPILQQYGYKLDLVTIKDSEDRVLDLHTSVLRIDNQRLYIHTKEDVSDWVTDGQSQKNKDGLKLDEICDINNKVLEDVLKGKSEGVLDFDRRSSKTDRSSEHSSGILVSFARRNSIHIDKETKAKSKKISLSNRSSVNDSLNLHTSMPPPKKPPIPKRQVVVEAPQAGKLESEELYEGLKRAQRSRLDDQRGTEINFELPDFLKPVTEGTLNKENHPCIGNRLADTRSSEQMKSASKENIFPDSQLPHDFDTDISFSVNYFDHSFTTDGVIPSHQQAEDYFSLGYPSNPQINDSRIGVTFGYPVRPELKPRPASLGFKQSACFTGIHVPPRVPPRWLGEARVTSEKTSPKTSSNGSLNNTLTKNVKDLEFDLDMDVTLKQSLLEDSMSPSKIPAPEQSSSSLHVEEANFSPPPPFDLDPLVRDDALHPPPPPPPPHAPFHRNSLDPPPLPPKPKATIPRGPPPRPPSRQLININPAFCHSSEDEKSDAENRPPDSVGLYRSSKADVLSQRVHARKPHFLDHDGLSDKFNISFV